MSTGAAILIAGITLIVLLLGGLYIHSMLLAVGIVGIIALGKSALLSGLLSYTTFTTVATYSMTTIPLYVLCARLSNLLERTTSRPAFLWRRQTTANW